MKNKLTLFFKNLFFKFEPAFLSANLETKLKHHKCISELFLKLRKKIIFYTLGFGILCVFLLKTPLFLEGILKSLTVNQSLVWATLSRFCFWSMLFCGVLYLTKLIKSSLLRDVDFFVARVQISTRYILRPSKDLQYKNIKSSHIVHFWLSALTIVPITILYHGLYLFLSGWILIPIFINIISFGFVGILQTNNLYYLNKTKNHHQKNIKYFLNIEKFIHRIHTLAFDHIIKKQILNFSENSSFLYLKMFKNKIIISSIKYCSVFLFFSLNSGLSLFVATSDLFIHFASVFLISTLIACYFIQLLKLFDFREGANEVFHLFKHIDALNEKSEPIEIQNSETNDKSVILFENASFVKDNQVVFHQMNQHIQENLLVAILGSTQEERSNYLSACAGNLTQIGGTAYRPKDFEFLSRNPVIFDGSIRENILQFHDYDQEFYQAVLTACALKNEIEQLPLNDLTKLDQYNSNFSLSFLKKITIARTVYSKARTIFFDDPFFGLSQQESAKVFFEAFQKILAGTTRIFSTDKTEYGSICDEIIVCKGGKIQEQGTHASLLMQNGVYAYLFYATFESKRIEIFQNYSQYDSTMLNTPTLANFSIKNKDTVQENAQEKQFQFNHDQIFYKIKQKFDKISHFIKMFFPVFISKNFYAFFTFLTLSVWTAIYAFHFVFQNLNINIAAKTSILFLSFSIIACISFSIMMIFYKNVYSTCAYIIENVSKIYFSELISQKRYNESYKQGSQNPGINGNHRFNWQKDHILLTTVNFFNQLLSFLLISLFVISLAIFTSTHSVQFLLLSFLCVSTIGLFSYLIMDTKLFYTNEQSIKLNFKIESMASQFFNAFHDTQSKNLRSYLFKKLSSKLYETYLLTTDDIKNSRSFLKMIGCYNLGQNYRTIETMVSSIKMTQQEFKSQTPPSSWPSNGVIQFQNVKFDSSQDHAIDMTISAHSRFFWTENNAHKKSVFIEKLMMLSPILSGEIKIDGEDLSVIDPIEVRKNIGYVSQNAIVPFLSIRDHLDPYGYYDDADIWGVLNKINLSQQVAMFKHGLATQMQHIPQEMHWSGEVILFSLARCILNENKIVCVDHIDASEEIENKIHAVFESDLKKCTLVFAGDNAKFKKICTMVYPEMSDTYSVNMLKTINNDSMITTSGEE